MKDVNSQTFYVEIAELHKCKIAQMVWSCKEYLLRTSLNVWVILSLSLNTKNAVYSM